MFGSSKTNLADIKSDPVRSCNSTVASPAPSYVHRPGPDALRYETVAALIDAAADKDDEDDGEDEREAIVDVKRLHRKTFKQVPTAKYFFKKKKKKKKEKKMLTHIVYRCLMHPNPSLVVFSL